MPHATHSSSNHNENADPEYDDDDWVDFEEVFVDYENGPPLKIRREATEECYQKANSKVNLAVQLVKREYSRKERATSNSSGDHRFGKKKLSPTRMTAMKDALYRIYPVRPSEKEETVWREFKIAIDNSCHQLNKPKQTR